MAKFSDFQWEDEEESLEQQSKDDEFARLLKEEPLSNVPLRVGEQVEGTILSLTPESDDVLVEISGSQTGVIDKKDLYDEDEGLSYKIGDKIKAYVTSMRGSIQLSKSLGKGHESQKSLEMAYEQQMPVRGKVMADSKGGFEVSVLGKKAFCPVSQIDLRFVEDKAPYIGRDFEFLIETFNQNGRNIVVSRKKLLSRLAEEKLQQLMDQGETDEVFTGVVTDLRDYGAFVDIGGIEGFLHISELSYSRVTKPSDLLTRGETIKVKVLSAERRDGKPRVSLSMKAIDQDPWVDVLTDFKEGESYPARVTRLTKHGAIVELKPGIEGMIHLSEMSWGKRVYDPQTICNVGDQIEVRILAIDSEAKRMSLSMKALQDDPFSRFSQEVKPGSEVDGKVEKLKGFGAIVRLSEGVTGLIPMAVLKKAFGEGYRKHSSPPKEIKVVIKRVDQEDEKVLLSLPNIEEDEDSFDFEAYEKEKSQQVKSAETGSFGLLLAERLKQGKS